MDVPDADDSSKFGFGLIDDLLRTDSQNGECLTIEEVITYMQQGSIFLLILHQNMAEHIINIG